MDAPGGGGRTGYPLEVGAGLAFAQEQGPLGWPRSEGSETSAAMCWGSGCGALESGSSPSAGEALALLALGWLLAFAGGSPSTSGKDPEGMCPFLHFSNISSSEDLTVSWLP